MKTKNPQTRVEFRPNFFGIALSLGSSGILGPDVQKFCKTALVVGSRIDNAYRELVQKNQDKVTKNQP